MGPRPVVHIAEPAMVKEVLGNNYQFQKPRGGNPLIKTLAAGLADAETDRWSKHRKIINPAFHVEKLKVLFRFLMSPHYPMNVKETTSLNYSYFDSIWCLQFM